MAPERARPGANPQVRHRVQGAYGEVGLGRLIREGLEQTAAYMDRCGAEAGHLVIFDLRPGASWEERLFRKDRSQARVP